MISKAFCCCLLQVDRRKWQSQLWHMLEHSQTESDQLYEIVEYELYSWSSKPFLLENCRIFAQIPGVSFSPFPKWPLISTGHSTQIPGAMSEACGRPARMNTRLKRPGKPTTFRANLMGPPLVTKVLNQSVSWDGFEGNRSNQHNEWNYNDGSEFPLESSCLDGTLFSIAFPRSCVVQFHNGTRTRW